MSSNIESRYLNAGGYIGYVKNIKEMFNWRKEEYINWRCKSGGDQAYFMEYFIENHEPKHKMRIGINQKTKPKFL